MWAQWENMNETITYDLWYIAIIINIIGNAISTARWSMQESKLLDNSLLIDRNDINNKNHKKNNKQQQKSKSKTSWYCGYIIYYIGDLLSKISYAFHPISLLLPLDSIKIIFNTCYTSRKFKKK